MKKLTKALVSSVCAVSMLAGAAMPAFACDLTAEELFEKYDFTYGWHEQGGLTRLDFGFGVGDGSWVWYDADGNVLEVKTLEDHYKICYQSDNEYSIYKHSGGFDYDFFHPVYNCEFEDGFYYAIKEDGTAVIAGCDYDYIMELTPTAIRIPEQIGGAVVTEIARCAFHRAKQYMKELDCVSIPDTVEIIRYGAFEGVFCNCGFNGEDCDGYLGATINIPKNLKYIGTIAFSHHAAWAFGDEIVLPESTEFLDGTAFNGSYGKCPPIRMPESLVFSGISLRSLEGKSFVDGKCNVVDWYDLVEYLNSKSDDLGQPPAAALPTDGTDALDSEYTLSDAILLARAVGGSYELSAAERAAADLNGDNAVDAADLSALLAILAGK